jgi:hypothetical protein
MVLTPHLTVIVILYLDVPFACVGRFTLMK